MRYTQAIVGSIVQNGVCTSCLTAHSRAMVLTKDMRILCAQCHMAEVM